MLKNFMLIAVFGASFYCAQAAVVVNGVVGEDDGSSPFETIQAALDYANDGSETVIEIQTNGPLAGASLSGRVLNHPLTIQSGNSFTPLLTTGLDLLPTTGSELITLSGINVQTTGLNTPLIVGCSLTATNCIFNANPIGGGAYGPGVTAAVPSPETTGVLTMTSCSLIGHQGLQAGRSCRDYILTRCEIIGQPTDLHPVFSVGIFNNMNWFSSFAYRMDSNVGLQVIDEPRTLTIDSCIVRGGVPLGWPNRTLDATHYQNENSTIGPITAVNTVFDALGLPGQPGESNQLNNPNLPPTQDVTTVFRHCTFRSVNDWGIFYFYGGQPTTYTFQNCLFDTPSCVYGIGIDGAATGVTLAGDANTYYMPAGVELFPPGASPFEATKHFYLGASTADPLLTNATGGLVTAHASVVAQALPTVPPIIVDKDGQPRPRPVSALASDIGADEIDETDTSAVYEWSLF